MPLGPTGYGDSPYQCFSAFAGNVYLISPEKLVDDGFLDKKDLAKAPTFDKVWKQIEPYIKNQNLVAHNGFGFAVRKGLDDDGGLWYEKEDGHLIKEKHWWPQAEAMVGFYNAFQITQNNKYLNLSKSSWEFTKQNIKDKKNGEWFWGVDENNKPLQNQDKVGIWKCPYHNARACIEIIKRIGI